MVKLKPSYSSQKVELALTGSVTALSNLLPALTDIKNMLVDETKLNFVGQHDPGGIPWKPLAAATIEARRRKHAKSGSGGFSEKILRDTDVLMNTIGGNVYPKFLEVGTPMEYGVFHQIGRGVPKRSFLGLNPRLEKEIEGMVMEYIEDSMNG